MLLVPPKILEILKFIEQKVDVISKPNSKYIPDQIEHEAAHSKNRILIMTQLVILLACFTDMGINQDISTTKIMRCLFLIGNCLVMVISCRYHPLIFNFFYIFASVAYGPLVMSRGEDGVHRAWFLSLTLPSLCYVLTESWWGYLFQIVFHMTYVNTIYQPAMDKSLVYLTPEAFNRFLTHSTNASIMFLATMTLLTHYFMRKSYQKMATIQKRKDEVENQKVFLLSFSHELRNLINSLTGNVKLAGFENMTQKSKELLANAEVCGELLLHLVNNILDTGKVEIGELEINPVPTRIYDTLEKIWGVCSELIKKKNLKGQIRIPRDLPKELVIDHYRLTQIFLNLVGNAVKYTETGLIDINVEWINLHDEQNQSYFRPYPFNFFDDYDEGLFEKQKHLGNWDNNIITLNLYTRKVNTSLLRQPSSNASKGILKVSISDTGCGMSHEETKKLFQKFTQVTTDPSKKQLGTGLGLFITKQLCQKMKGDVRAYSQKNNGSSFIFCIPAKIAIIPKQVGHLQDMESLKKYVSTLNLKAMIVDDIPFNCSILKSFFDKLGINVIDIAPNGLEAYKKYLEHNAKGARPDIVTMDLDMPVMNGKDSARKIRQVEIEKGLKPCFLPIISGNCSESEISECMSKNGNIRADEFIKKPATLDELLRAVGTYFYQQEYA